MLNEEGKPFTDRFIPLEGMPFVCSYLTSRDIERLSSTCRTMSSLVDATVNMLPKKIEQCALIMKDGKAKMRFNLHGGYNDKTVKTSNGFIISCFLHKEWEILSMDNFHIELKRKIDKDFWDSLSSGFALTLFDGFHVNMPLTEINVNGLSYVMRSARFDEFRIGISEFDSMEIGERVTDLIGSRINLEREHPHLTYALVYFKGTPFQIAADFLISLSNKVPSFEVEQCEKLGGWRKLLTFDHIEQMSRSRCTDIALDPLLNDNLTADDFDKILKLFLASTFSRIIRVNIPNESVDRARLRIPSYVESLTSYRYLLIRLPDFPNSRLEASPVGITHQYMKLTVNVEDE